MQDVPDKSQHRSIKRIGIECESLEGASWGIGRMTQKLIEELSHRPELKERFCFTLYFNGPVPEMPWLDHELFHTRSVGLPSMLGKCAPLSFSIYYYILLPLRLWLDRPSMMYWPNYMLPIIAPWPSLVMLTEDIWHEMRNPRRPLRYKLGYWVFANWAAFFATRIMAISHASRDALVNLFGIAPERIVVNELAVDAPKLISNIQPLISNTPYFLYVGQAFERRHLYETLQAFEEMALDDKTLRFIVIGPDKYDPPIIDKLISDINARLRRPAIQHIERVSEEDLARFYAGALAVVYISDLEAFGLPPLEALSYGIPPIVADLPVHREVLGVNAFYVAKPDVEHISQAFDNVLHDTEKREGIRNAGPEVIKRYTWENHANRFLQIASSMTK